MEMVHLRHAAFILTYHGKRILVDPMLAPKGKNPPIPGTPRPRRNPLVELPMGEKALAGCLDGLDAVLVTHTHKDHYDAEAASLLRKNLLLFGQPEDMARFLGDGFSAPRIVPMDKDGGLVWKGIQILRTSGQHGLGRTELGPVSGFILKAPDEPVVYITGDTVWCPEVAGALDRHTPEIVIAFAGAARFLDRRRITMDLCHLGRILRRLPEAMLVAVHMEALNHCLLTRAQVREWADKEGFGNRVLIPEDGEALECKSDAPRLVRGAPL